MHPQDAWVLSERVSVCARRGERTPSGALSAPAKPPRLLLLFVLFFWPIPRVWRGWRVWQAADAAARTIRALRKTHGRARARNLNLPELLLRSHWGPRGKIGGCGIITERSVLFFS